MAQRVVVTLFDDIDGGEAAETVVFGLDGKSYEIDLNEANAKKLREALAPYVEAGRRHKATRAGKAAKAAKAGKGAPTPKHTAVTADPAAVRAWARSHKMDVPARGRIPKKVYEAFEAAN
ncbi:histone-like nucleoid-structuring protein Lsr2 [Streptomyces sp. NPDC002851]